MRKVLSQQFLTDQHAQIVLFFHIVVLASLLNKTAYLRFALLSASPSQLSDCKILLDKYFAYWGAPSSWGDPPCSSSSAPLRAVRQDV